MAPSLPPQATPMDAPTLETYRRTFTQGATPLGIARPRSVSEVAKLVQWARKRRVPLSVFSSSAGANTGRSCNRVSALYVDMSEMRRVIAVDRTDRVAVVEAGVTFKQLDLALAPHGMQSYKPLQPRASKSVLASYLDREPILQSSEHWDILDPIGAGEIVFGTGETFRTGTASGEKTPAEMWNAGVRFLTPFGPGAVDFMRVVQGSQGTLGLVPWAAVLCEPVPLCSESFFVGSDELEPLVELAICLERRRFGHSIFVANRLQLTSLWEAQRPPRAPAAQLPAWILYLELAAKAELPTEQLAYEKQDLMDEAARLGLRVLGTLAGRAAAEVTAAQSSYPATSYKARISGDYEEVFFLTTLDKAPTFIGLARRLAAEHGWPASDVAVYVQPRLQGRNCHLEFVLPFSPRDQERREQARRLAHALSEASASAGGFFSRPYGHWSQLARAANPSIADYMRHTKSFFDPDRILNPGRLSALLGAA